jgi:hypothetical protein
VAVLWENIGVMVGFWVTVAELVDVGKIVFICIGVMSDMGDAVGKMEVGVGFP